MYNSQVVSNFLKVVVAAFSEGVGGVELMGVDISNCVSGLLGVMGEVNKKSLKGGDGDGVIGVCGVSGSGVQC